MFKPLTKENIGGITDLLLEDVNKRLSDRGIKIELSPKAKELVIEKGYEPVYGARPLRRYLQKNVETLAAKIILGENELGMGDTIYIDVKDDNLVAEIKK